MSSILVERPELQEKALKIADMVAHSLEMSMFKQAEHDLRKNTEAQDLLADVQRQQRAGEEVDAVLDRLEQLDVVRRFTIAQESLAEVMAHTTKILAATLSDRLDLVTESSDCCSGCTGGSCDSGGASCESLSACSGSESCAV
jgi:cell fate (sporulation/competence/biofilm development) regulator YmcA (YheA/YmcA/DUF963 family)